jgi:hypothetical protein
MSRDWERTQELNERWTRQIAAAPPTKEPAMSNRITQVMAARLHDAAAKWARHANYAGFNQGAELPRKKQLADRDAAEQAFVDLISQMVEDE